MNILIGDDHLLFREGMRRLLETLSPDVAFWEAGSFDEMRQHACSGTVFNLALMDLQMPGWRGHSDIGDIKNCLKDTPLVVLSASENPDDVKQAMTLGASGFIPKSSSVKVMMSAINLIFSGGTYLPPVALGSLSSGELKMPPRTGSEGMGRTDSDPLTPRQKEVLRCLQEGKSNKQIAYELNLSEGTVKIHVTAIFRTLGVRNRTQAVIAARTMDLSQDKTDTP